MSAQSTKRIQAIRTVLKASVESVKLALLIQAFNEIVNLFQTIPFGKSTFKPFRKSLQGHYYLHYILHYFYIIFGLFFSFFVLVFLTSHFINLKNDIWYR